jgi:hypothetical protein
MSAEALLATMAATALAATGIGALVRAAPWPERWKERKPLACPACLAGHGSLVALAIALAGGVLPWPGLAEAIILFFGGTGGAAFLLAQTGLFAPPLPGE